jgi:hypothetical protein
MKELEHVEGAEDEEDDDIDGWLDEEALLSEEEQKDMKRDLLPIRTVLVKVQCLSLADARDAEGKSSATKAGLQDCELVYRFAACLEGDAEGIGAGRGVTATRRSHEVELHLPHVGLCSPPWGGVGSVEWRAREQLEGAGTEQSRMAVGGAIARRPQGESTVSGTYAVMVTTLIRRFSVMQRRSSPEERRRSRW